jgi:predicted ATP-grasp superfamily ATP-dependent carboligase
VTTESLDALRFERRPALKEPTLVLAFSGWSDAGAAASTAVTYLASQTGAEKFAAIDGEEFFDFTVQRPMVRLDAQQIRQLTWPTYEFSAADGVDLVFAVGPEPHLRWRSFCGNVVRCAKEVGIARVALLGSFLADVLYSDPVPLTGFASDPAILGRLNVQPTGYEGPTGIAGAIADAFRREGFTIGSLWAAIPHYVAATPNPRGALALVLKLREWIGVTVDLAPLEAAAVAFQSQLVEAVEADADLSKYVRKLRKSETSH